MPGLATQRLMGAGIGFAGEGDWKTAALVRVMKTMASGLPKGTSFTEDYTYHLEPGNELVLGAHMHQEFLREKRSQGLRDSTVRMYAEALRV